MLLMSNVWFIADTHFCHKNILNYSKRPFDNIEEMNEVIIDNWNKNVKRNDCIYHLGDFSFYNKKSYNNIFDRLNGNKFLIRGNHDKYACKGWIWVKNYSELKINNISVILSHYSHRVWNKSNHGSFHLYGHSHGHLPPNGKSFDVGVDCWGYNPINFDEVMWAMNKLQKINIDHNVPWNGLKL